MENVVEKKDTTKETKKEIMTKIIDFHTHIFPEKIAAAAVGKLSSIIHLDPSINGCEDGLLASMKEAGIDISLVLPVVTQTKQFDSILKYASYLNETYAEKQTGRIISFAGIHPDSEHMKEELALISREGFKGIKIHPNYQGVDFNDIRFKRILYEASSLDLTVLTHAGFDPYTPNREYCTPEMIAENVKEVAPKKLVAAHMGSNCFYEKSFELLCGLDLYLDTAYSIANMPVQLFEQMVQKHGADKILFASDCPWADQKNCLNILMQSTLTYEEKQAILYDNAKELIF